MVYGDFKDLNRRTAANKILRDKVLNITIDRKYYGYQRELASMVYNVFEKKSSVSGIKNVSNKELAEELHRSIIRKFD